jgi:hypothetical protein
VSLSKKGEPGENRKAGAKEHDAIEGEEEEHDAIGTHLFFCSLFFLFFLPPFPPFFFQSRRLFPLFSASVLFSLSFLSFSQRKSWGRLGSIFFKNKGARFSFLPSFPFFFSIEISLRREGRLGLLSSVFLRATPQSKES